MKYTLDCNYVKEEFNTLQDVLDYTMRNGVDPNLTILKDGKDTGEQVSDLLFF